MPFRITIEKYMASAAEYWTNIYHAPGNDVAAAGVIAAGLVAAELPLYNAGIIITKYRVDDMVEDTDVGHTEVVNAVGTSGQGNVNMPLFVVVRVDFSTIGGGRPSRKYIRGTLQEDDVTFTSLGASPITRCGIYAAAAIGTGFVDIDQQGINSYAVLPFPAMRQLRRGSKKKVAP